MAMHNFKIREGNLWGDYDRIFKKSKIGGFASVNVTPCITLA
jgi:hypothetical protein